MTPSAGRRIRILPDRAALAEAAGEEVGRALAAALAARPTASWVLAGGSTPAAVYRWLAELGRRPAVDWERVHLFWGDERAVPPDDPASNYRRARETLLAGPPGGARVHRIRGELPAEEAAAEYEAAIAAALGPRPRFDLALLGVGADGHTASLFPGGAELEAPGAVTVSRAPVPPRERISLTLSALSAARRVIFLVAGREKAAAVARILGGGPGGAGAAERAGPAEGADPGAAALPAALVRATEGETLWMLDRVAASGLSRE